MLKINKLLILIYTISFASLMVNLDTYVVNVALPSITESFGAVTSDISWVVMAYNLMVVSLLLIFGKLGDTIGLKKLFNIGFIIFSLSSLMCGLANSVGFLVFSRFLQGIGASILYALPQALIAKYLPKERRGMAFGILASAAALGITLGAPVSGFITEFLSWRWIFFINVPIGILSVLFLNYSASEKLFENKSHNKFDFLGGFLSFIFALFFTLLINKLNVFGIFSKESCIFIVIAVFALILFIIRALKIENPILNLQVFKNLNFDFANIAMFLVSAYLAATNFLIPFYLTKILNFSLVKIGFFFMLYSVSYMLTSLISGKLSNKISLRIVCAVSMFILSLNIVGLVTSMNEEYNILFLYPFFIISGITMSFFITSNNNLVMLMAKRGEEGMIAGTHRLIGRLGMLIGVAVFEALYTFSLRFGSLQAFEKCYLFAAIICFLASVFSLLVKNYKIYK